MKCRTCYADIEAQDGVWWTTGTARTVCYGAAGEFNLHAPDLADIDAVEEWLNS